MATRDVAHERLIRADVERATRPIDIGSRVRVDIRAIEGWAVGAVNAMNGKTGEVTDVRTVERYTGAPLPKKRVLVTFDTPAEKWWSVYQTPATGFWFDIDEVVGE